MPKGKVVAHRWKIKQKLGEGGFGAVYKVVNMETMTPAALKVETIRKHGVLKLEAMILRRLADYPFFPHLLDSGKKATYSYIILTLLGPSLNKILKLYGKVCSVSTQVRVGINVLFALKQLHDIGFVHRDLKPGNLAVGPVGTPQFRLIHMFDFGLARQYVITSEGGRPKMRRPRPRVHFRGTLRYCSINCHEKGEQGRDDDLWCYLYMLIELRGPLPWAIIREGPNILEVKKTVDLEEMLKNCPVEFISIAQHLMTLNYYLRPNYALIYRLLMQVMNAGNFNFSDPYDWEMKSSIPSSAECARDLELECTQGQTSGTTLNNFSSAEVEVFESKLTCHGIQRIALFCDRDTMSLAADDTMILASKQCLFNYSLNDIFLLAQKRKLETKEYNPFPAEFFDEDPLGF